MVAVSADEVGHVPLGPLDEVLVVALGHLAEGPFVEDLVYLMGGENLDFEVAEFPKLGKRMVRRSTGIEIYDIADAKPFGPLTD